MRVVDDQAGLMRARRRAMSPSGATSPSMEKTLSVRMNFGPVIAVIRQEARRDGRVAMTVADLPRARRLAAEMHACVIEAVGEDERFGAEHASVEKRLKRRGVGLEAGSHDERRLLGFQARELGLDRRNSRDFR